MNRRKAIVRISIAGAGLASAAGGYTFWSISKTPDLAYAEKNLSLLSALAETIIPSTDTPGARETVVQEHILKIVRFCLPRKEQNTFLTGLTDVQEHSRAHFGAPYERLSPKDQVTVLAHFEEKGRPWKGTAGKIRQRYLGRSFFTLLKFYTVEGYCTSRLGATEGLAYLYIPGSFQACLPIKPGQKAWATN